MPERDSVSPGHLAIGELAIRGQEDHDQAKQAAPGNVQLDAYESASTAEDDGEHAGHVERMVTGQEDVGHAREARKDDVEHHAEGHDDSRGGTKGGEGIGDDGLVVRDDPLHVEGKVEDLAKGEQRVRLQKGGSRREDQKAHDGLEGALYDVLDWLALQTETQQGQEANQYGRGRQDVDDKAKCSHVLLL